MPHLRTSPSLFAATRSLHYTTLRSPLNKRFFTPSATNMTIKAYFDVSWTGPEIQVDGSGNVTSTGAVKGKPLMYLCLLHLRAMASSSLSFPMYLRINR